MGGNTEGILVVIPADMSSAEDLATTNVSIAFALSALSPHTDYVITVEANTCAGYGNRSEELHIQTSRHHVSLVVCMCVCVCVCVCLCVCVLYGCVHLL